MADGVSWLEANPFVLNALAAIALAQSAEDKPDSLTFSLGQSHPLYEAVGDPPLYDLDRDGHYSFFVRVPDLPAFLLQVAPVLEERLAGSVAAPHPENSGDAAFPDLTFLQLLFGHHSLEELSHTLPDCSPGRGDTQALLQALFPKHPSNLQPV